MLLNLYFKNPSVGLYVLYVVNIPTNIHAN